MNEFIESVAAAFAEIARAFQRALRSLAEAVDGIVNVLSGFYARRGVDELEMELKLRAEMPALRTDLLALFDALVE